MTEEKTCGNCATFFPKSKLCKAYGFRCEVCAENKACAKWRKEIPLPVMTRVKHSRCSFMPIFNQYYCPHCKRQLGLVSAEKRPEVCSMCGKKISWKVLDK